MREEVYREHRITWRRGKRFRRSAQRGVATAMIVVGAVIFMTPFYWMIRTSLMHSGEIFLQPIRWLPSRFLWQNYPKVWNTIPFFHFVRNSCIVTLAGTIGAVLSSSVVAYGFARIRAPGKEVLFALLLISMMLPSSVRLVPTYLLFRFFGWLDTYKPLIVPQYFGTAFYVFMLRQFFMTLPLELDDAARIDGCGLLGIFWRLILPLSKPALATVAIFSFYANWDAFMEPMIYLNTMSKYTLPIGLLFFADVYGRTDYNLLMAASIMSLLPCLVIFFVGQRLFVQGIVLTGLKG